MTDTEATLPDDPRLIPGSELLPRDFGPVGMTEIVRYQGASGDMNPMHHDDELARSAGYPAAFSVGMLGAGYLASYCTDLYGIESIRRLRTRFHAIVFRGETLRANAQVTSAQPVPGGIHVTTDLALVNGSGDLVISGSAAFWLEGTLPPY